MLAGDFGYADNYDIDGAHARCAASAAEPGLPALPSGKRRPCLVGLACSAVCVVPSGNGPITLPDAHIRDWRRDIYRQRHFLHGKWQLLPAQVRLDGAPPLHKHLALMKGFACCLHL